MTEPQTATNGRTPILDLDDLTEPGATVSTGGNTYHYVRWSALGLLARNQINKRFQRIDELEKLEEATEADGDEHKRITREVVAMITDIPREVIDTIEQERLENCCSYFLALRAVRKQQQQSMMATALPSLAPLTGANESPASIASGRKKKAG